MAKKDEYLPVVPTEETFPALNPATSANIAEVIETNIGDSFSFQDLERIKFPTGGMTLWTIPTVDGEEHKDVLAGIIVAQKSTRQYWKDAFSGGGAAPDCQSFDMVKGTGLYQGVPCATCPLNQFGSAVNQKGEPGKGKACKEVKNVLIILEGQLLPVLVAVPPTSLKALKQYNVKMASRGLPYYGAITEFRLRKTKNADGIDYAETIISMGSVLSAQQIESIKSYVSGFSSALQNAAPAPSGPEFES